MSEQHPAPSALSPFLSSGDVDASVAFYEKFGFTVDGAFAGEDGKTFYAMLRTPCGRSTFMVSLNPGDKVAEGKGMSLYASLPEGYGVDEAFARFRDGGATILEQPETQFWGDRTFAFADPDGYRWVVSQKVAEMKMPEGVKLKESKVLAQV